MREFINIVLYGFISHFIIPQLSFSQSDYSICGQYDVILPFLDKKYYPDARFIENVNKVDVIYI